MYIYTHTQSGLNANLCMLVSLYMSPIDITRHRPKIQLLNPMSTAGLIGLPVTSPQVIFRVILGYQNASKPQLEIFALTPSASWLWNATSPTNGKIGGASLCSRRSGGTGIFHQFSDSAEQDCLVSQR